MNPNRPPSSRYCDYHEDTWHTTERCCQLKNLIEDKVQNGEFAHFIAKEEPLRQSRYDQDKIIDVISGGYSGGGASNRSKRAYAREVFRVALMTCHSGTHLSSATEIFNLM